MAKTDNPEESPAKYVQRLAVEKAQAVLALHPEDASTEDHATVLAADTCVLCNGEVLGKPVDQGRRAAHAGNSSRAGRTRC